MPETIKISRRQLALLATLVTIGDSILVLPAIPTLEAKRDAWVCMVIGLAAGLLVISLFVSASRLNPKLTLVELNERILGKWAGTSVSILFLGYGLLCISAHLREIGDFATSQIMSDTPVEAIHILLLLLIIMGVRLGLETFTRVAELFFPWFFLFFVVFTLSFIPDIDPHKIQPVFDQGIKPVLRGSIACVAFPFMDLFMFMMIFPSVNKTNEVRRAMFFGAILGGIVLIITVTLTILVVGAEPVARNMYPSYDLAKRISIGEFFRRIEAILAIMWIITVYFKVTVYFYALNLGLGQVLKLKEDRMLLLPLGMIIFTISLVIAPNVAYYNNFAAKYWPYMELTFSVFLPLLLIAGNAVRKT